MHLYVDVLIYYVSVCVFNVNRRIISILIIMQWRVVFLLFDYCWMKAKEERGGAGEEEAGDGIRTGYSLHGSSVIDKNLA